MMAALDVMPAERPVSWQLQGRRQLQSRRAAVLQPALGCDHQCGQSLRLTPAHPVHSTPLVTKGQEYDTMSVK